MADPLKKPSKFEPLVFKKSNLHEPLENELGKVDLREESNTGEVFGETEESEEEPMPDTFLGLGVTPVQQYRELRKAVNGFGGKIPQHLLYASPASADAWMEETALEDYKAAAAIPVGDVVDGLVKRIRKIAPEQAHLEIIALGSGEAYQEQRIIQTICRKNIVEGISLYLVEVSSPLLCVGLEACQRVLAAYPQVKTQALYQDFRDLPQNRKFLYSSRRSNQVKLVTMLGNTFGNLESEIFFVRDTLNPFPSKTLLLIDVGLAYGVRENPEEIKQKDPWLVGRPPWIELAEKRWAVPFIEHHPKVKTVKDVTFLPVLDNRTAQVEGSYVIEVKAFVGKDQWTVLRIKRYDMEGLVEQFRLEGWSLVSTYPFGENKRLAILFQKD